MNKIFLFFFLLISTFSSLAQNRPIAIIRGKVIDSISNKTLELATVAILDVKDTSSSLISYTLSDKTGMFTLHNMPVGVPLKILISFVSYQPYRKIFTIKRGETVDLGIIPLSHKLLNEVIIKGERPPVVVRKDTIEFNAEAFKTRPNAVVEDLLKKLPGIEVDNQGNIIFNGKSVKKIMVDGHEFFSNDPRIASRNLDADMIDKVQVYDDRENDPNHIVPQSQVNKIINLKFKKALKKSVFGKVFGGSGTEGRYTAGGLINMFRDTLQISMLGQGNNLNNTGFSFDDLYSQGGFNRGGAETFYRGGLSSFGGFSSSGIQRVLSSGINVNTDYGKRLKINLSYYYTRDHNDYNSITNKQQFLSDTDFTTKSANSRIHNDNKHNLSATVRIQPNDATQIIYNPTFSYTDNHSVSSGMVNSLSNFIPQIALTNNTDNNISNNMQFGQSFSYNHQFKRQGESINISHSLRVNPDNGTDYNISDLTSFTPALASYDLNRFSKTINRNTDASMSVSYRYPFSKKLTGTVDVSDEYNHQVNNTITYDFDPSTGLYDSFLQTLSTNLTRNQAIKSISPGITYNFKEGYQLVTSVNTELLQVINRFDRNVADINRHFIYFLPSVNITLNNISLGYQYSFNLPNIGDLIPYTVIFSPLFRVTGNPDLKPTTRNNFSFGYNAYKMESQVSIYTGANASFEENGIFRRRTIDAVGAETSTPINMNGRYNFSSNGRISKRFKKRNDITLSEATGLSVGTSRGFFEINRQDGYQYTYNFNIDQQFSINWKDIIELAQSYRLNTSVVNYKGINYNHVNNTTHVLDTHFNVFWPKHINIEGTYTYTYNPLVSPGFQKSANLVNLSIARALLKKDRAEIKLSCYDILNQNISSFRYINENTITDTQSQVLRRYFLLTLQFKFNKSLIK
ncbi:MAG: outer rane beta-barrel protein [Mucilaginibacter sp.]|nr:outer rane beta-barrel protein [Mucilaginibacter sp.]